MFCCNCVIIEESIEKRKGHALKYIEYTLDEPNTRWIWKCSFNFEQLNGIHLINVPLPFPMIYIRLTLIQPTHILSNLSCYTILILSLYTNVAWKLAMEFTHCNCHHPVTIILHSQNPIFKQSVLLCKNFSF